VRSAQLPQKKLPLRKKLRLPQRKKPLLKAKIPTRLIQLRKRLSMLTMTTMMMISI
jgi:hypothetical protein